jgi:tRNA (guanine10-N2)-dimethyltransferase
MDYTVLLSQEHPALPEAEARAVLNAERITHAITERQDNLLFVDADRIQEAQVERLAMTYEVGKGLYAFEPDSYQKLAAKRSVSTDDPFAVRTVQIDDTAAPAELERNVGRIIDKESSGHVDLDNPETSYRIYLADGMAYLCELVADIDRSQYEQRQNQYRPYSSPVSIHPRLARAIVNLSEAPLDGTVLDPFCGTGGILLEAALTGCDVYGMDIQQEMVDGSQDNLDAFNVSGDIRQGAFDDIQDVFDDVLPVDAIVTDLPYGKASTVEGNPTETFLDTADDLTDGRVVFMTNTDDLDGLEPAFEIYVHRSLSRYVYIMD